jgi:NAD(P)-dependent dehydrogenase (short-subunit alcohol dehydrogenase family)
VAESIIKAGGKAVAVPGDMLDAKYIKKLVHEAAEFGHGKIHIIVNNAGWVILLRNSNSSHQESDTHGMESYTR